MQMGLTEAKAVALACAWQPPAMASSRQARKLSIEGAILDELTGLLDLTQCGCWISAVAQHLKRGAI